jgi:hypothetical protein
MRKQLPLLLTGISALWVVLCHFIHQFQVAKMMGTTDQWNQIIIATMTFVGAVNLTRIHGTHIQRRRSGYFNSIALLLSLWVYTAVGIYFKNNSTEYRWVYNATVVPWEATMFAMIAFFISSAAYRTFRIRTAEAAVMGLVAAFVMLGNVPIGPVISDQIPLLKDWLMNVPNGAGFRAIRIGIYIGMFAAAMRIALGLERAHLGSGAQ